MVTLPWSYQSIIDDPLIFYARKLDSQRNTSLVSKVKDIFATFEIQKTSIIFLGRTGCGGSEVCFHISHNVA